MDIDGCKLQDLPQRKLQDARPLIYPAAPAFMKAPRSALLRIGDDGKSFATTDRPSAMVASTLVIATMPSTQINGQITRPIPLRESQDAEISRVKQRTQIPVEN
jgi:hypothetical protein